MSIIEDFKSSALQRTSDLVKNIERGGLNWLARGPVDTTMNFDDLDFVFRKQNNSYSGTDCTVVVIYNKDMIILGNLQTFSYSIFKEKSPVRTLGRVLPKGYTSGGRTVAGSMVFITFDEHPLYPLFKYFDKRTDKIHRYSFPKADDIPPFDVMLIFNNEYGAKSIIRMYGVEIGQEGSVFSINDIYSENVMEYIAKDIDPMISAGNEGSWKELLFTKMTEGKVIDEHFASMLKYRQKLEGQISILIQQIDAHARSGRGLVKFSDRDTDKRYERKQNRLAERQLAAEKQKLLKSLLDELKRLDSSINQWEKTRMSWDMNTAFEPVSRNMNEQTSNTHESSPSNIKVQ